MTDSVVRRVLVLGAFLILVAGGTAAGSGARPVETPGAEALDLTGLEALMPGRLLGLGPVSLGRGDGGPVPGITGPVHQDWRVFTGQMGMWTPVCGDWDPKYPGLEVVVAVSCVDPFTVDVWTHIFAMHADGTFMEGWGPKRIDDGAPHDVPALGDLDGDGSLELVMSFHENLLSHFYVTVFKANGEAALVLWPIEMEESVTSAAVLVDLDDDGQLEILVACKDHKLYIWRADGTPFLPGVWPMELGGILYRSPAVGRFERGGDIKIVIGCEEIATGRGIVYVLNPDGSSHSPAWPRYVEVDWTVFTPTIADIDGNGTAEIVIGGYDHLEAPYHIHALRPDGTTAPGLWPVEYFHPEGRWPPGALPHNISVGDIDPNYPGLEVVTAPENGYLVHALHCDGTVVSGWPYARSDSAFVGNPVAVGNIDGTDRLDLVVGDGQSDSDNGRRLYLLRADGTDLEGSPLDMGGFIQVGCFLADIDRDSRIEIIQPVAGTGMIECLELLGPGLGPDAVVWPTQQGGNCRTGFYDWFPEAHTAPEPTRWMGRDGSSGSSLRLWVMAPHGGSAGQAQLWVARRGRLDLSLFSASGRRVSVLARGIFVAPGRCTFALPSATALASGVYFLRATLHTQKGVDAAFLKYVVVQ